MYFVIMFINKSHIGDMKRTIVNLINFSIDF